MDFLSQIFGAMNMEVSIIAVYNEEEQELSLNLEGDDMGILIGKRGQTLDSMTRDISLGLACFERICVNIMCPNTMQVEPDGHVISVFFVHLREQLCHLYLYIAA